MTADGISYHTHTTWSDGKAGIADMVAAASRLGLAEVGISDHLVIHPSGTHPCWSMDPARLEEYVADVRRFCDSGRPIVRVGVEADWYQETQRDLAEALAGVRLDYVIGAVHEIDGLTIDADPRPWDTLSEGDRNELHRLYWDRIRGLASTGLFDIVAHLDLPKKFGHRATADLSTEIAAALDAIAEAHLVVELNTSGWFLPCAEAYPSTDLLLECRQRGIATILSADAHRPEHLVRGFDQGREELISAGFDHVATFCDRRRTLVPLV